MKILLTGCFGFISSHIAARLLNSGHEVLGFDNLVNPSLYPSERIKSATGPNWKNFKFYKYDIREREGMISICTNERPDLIVHMAALGSISRSFLDPAETIDVNERGFANILCMASVLGIKRVVFASSSNVYGAAEQDVRVEGEEGAVMNPYGLSKRHNEILARIWSNQSGIEYIGLRFFNVYGPGQNPNGPYAAVIPRFCLDKDLTIFGDGSSTRDFTYVGDVAKIVETAMLHKMNNFCVNVGTGQETSILELANLLADGRDIVYKPARAGEIKHSKASVENLKRILNISPYTPLIDGLKITKEFYRCQTQDQKME